MPQHYVIVISGPTGVGKTHVAIALAKALKTEVINADSRQVYRELIIGVGRPNEDQLTEVRHHLIGHVSIHEPYSVGQYAIDANNALHDIFKNHTTAILCGGTGLYLKSIMEGLDDFPEIPKAVADKWDALFKESGIEPLVTALKQMDPVYASAVDLQNPARLIRALAVSDHTGQPFSSFRSAKKKQSPYHSIPIEVTLPRDELYARINQRVVDMIKAGWYDEAKSLYPFKTLKALQTVGYQELFDVIEGKRTMEDAIQAIQQSTRNYAKRQMTWFRNQGTWNQFHPEDVEGMIKLIEGHITP
jgi:tRNA dimethylallyltransferase